MKPGISNCQFCLLTIQFLCSILLVNTEPLVETSQGILNGTIQESRSGRRFSAFLGIPYGKPPVWNFRFANPVAAGNWTGIRAANSFGSICIQIKNNVITGAEDCLFLNVYTPFLEFNSSPINSTLLPVMVWIHGGAFIGGSSNKFGAQYLLDKDVILVTINYRLGIFGFLSTGDAAAPGNFGMKDQVLALKWVQKNIIVFGGDSNRVTIFGESSGGASVALHAISKASTGLFQRYIIQSGASLAPWAYQRRINFIAYIRALSPLVACPLITSKGLVNCMRGRSPEVLLHASSVFSIVLRLIQLTWIPTDEPDSEEAFLTDSPINLVTNNQIKDLPFMSGVVAEEGLLITGTVWTIHLSTQNYIGLIAKRLKMKPMAANDQFYLWMLHLVCSILLVNAEPLLKTSQGILNGTIQESRSGRKYSAFLGIPYGLPPVGRLRFANPVAAGNWRGIRAANSFGNMCIQMDDNNKIKGAEDCLFLNVYTPLIEFNSLSMNSTLLPVMVWIHGGSFSRGSSNNFGAQYILDKDIILVTINYRLGIFGFLSTGNSDAPGNFGLKDQVLALKWVQTNIITFGGDSNRVTLFGQSSGGASVALHAISEASNGLFQKYIIQSGTSLSPWAYQRRSNFIVYIRTLSPLLACPLVTSAGIVNCLRETNPASLLTASFIFNRITRFTQLTWTPTDEPDSEDAFLTDSPKNLVANNQVKDLPFMSGVVADEGLAITNVSYSSNAIYSLLRISAGPLIAYIGAQYLEPPNLLRFTSAVTSFYFNNSFILVNRNSFLDSATRFISDGFFYHPQLRMLETVTPKISSPNYFYTFEYRGSVTKYNGLGVGHSGELMYLFNSQSTQISNIMFTAADLAISKTMVEMWTSFATNGKPTSNELKNPNIWLPYTTKNPVHLEIGNINKNGDANVTLSHTFYMERMNFWRKNAPIL